MTELTSPTGLRQGARPLGSVHGIESFIETKMCLDAGPFLGISIQRKLTSISIHMRYLEYLDFIRLDFILWYLSRDIPNQCVVMLAMDVVRVDTDSPYFVTRTRALIYEFSRYTELFGPEFVAKACDIVRRQKTESGVKEKTWIDDYVVRFAAFLDALAIYLDADKPGSKQRLSGMKPSDWEQFGDWFRDRIVQSSISEATKFNRIHYTNKLVGFLVIEGLVSVKFEMMPLVPLSRARLGESRFTQKGWNNKPKAVPEFSPLVLRIDRHKRSYDYSAYKDIAPRFIHSMMPVLNTIYAECSASVAKNAHNALLKFLGYLAQRSAQQPDSIFFQLLCLGRMSAIDGLKWEKIIYQWRDEVQRVNSENGCSPKTAHAIVMWLAFVWRHLAVAGCVPDVKIVGFKNAKRVSNTKSKRSLAQLFVSEAKISAAEEKLLVKIERFTSTKDKAEAREFIGALCREISPKIVAGLTLEDLVLKMHDLNASRLRVLRNCAEDEFLRWYEHWIVGTSALAQASFENEKLVDLLDNPMRSTSERRRNSTRYLYSGNQSVRLGNVLQYFLATQQGVFSGILGRYCHIAPRWGGRAALQAYLHPHANMTIALWVMLLIDTGANCEVVRDTPWDCLAPGEAEGSFILQLGAKNRSGGQVIVDELRDDPEKGQRLSSVDAIRKYRCVAARFHSMANEPNASKLLLYVGWHGKISAITEWHARDQFKRFVRGQSSLPFGELRPSMIRPSVLMSLQHENAEMVTVAQVFADHARPSTTLAHYTGRIPAKLTYNLMIREFQQRFQSVVVASIEGAAAKLGLTQEEMRRIFAEAARTGLGVACLDPLAGMQPGTKVGEHCTRLDACWNCDNRWVVATIENVADLILFNEYLASAQDDASRTHPEAWEQRWLPWLVFSDIALAKLAQGNTAKIYDEASKFADSKRARYQVFPLF